jgi:hypothetical protein
LEHGSLVVQEGLHRLTQILDKMKPVDDLLSLRCSLANAISIDRTSITTDDPDGGMLCEPGRHGRR